MDRQVFVPGGGQVHEPEAGEYLVPGVGVVQAIEEDDHAQQTADEAHAE